MKRFFIVFLCVFLTLVLVCASPARAIAGVDDLVIAGVAVMSMAVVGSLGIIAINSAGFSDALLAAADNAGTGVKIFAQELFESYAKSQNITAGQAVQIAQQGTSYLEDGSIIFSESMSNMMSGFLDWVWSEDGGDLIDYASSTPSSSDIEVNYSNVDLTVMNYPQFAYDLALTTDLSVTRILKSGSGSYSYSFSASSPGFFYISIPSTLNSLQCFYVSDVPFSVSRSQINNSNNSVSVTNYSSSSFTRNNLTYYSVQVLSVSLLTNDYTSNVSLSSVPSDTSNWDIPYLIYNGQLVSDDNPNYDVNLGVLDGITDAGQVNVIDPDTLITPTDAPVSGGTISIDDWIAYLADAIAEGVASVPVDVDGAVTDISLELDNTSDIPVSVTDSITGSRPVADSSSIDDLTPYTLDLTDFFPFCIPFDLYDMYSLFAGSREAPSFEYRFYVPGVVDQSILIDLSAFDSVAQVLRTMEDIAFAIGLAWATKSLIQGGD